MICPILSQNNNLILGDRLGDAKIGKNNNNMTMIYETDSGLARYLGPRSSLMRLPSMIKDRTSELQIFKILE